MDEGLVEGCITLVVVTRLESLGIASAAILSTRRIGRMSQSQDKYATTEGHLARKEADTHADTCCAGAHWKIMELTGDVCEVTPFLDSYKPTKEIPLARCGTVWTDPSTT